MKKEIKVGDTLIAISNRTSIGPNGLAITEGNEYIVTNANSERFSIIDDKSNLPVLHQDDFVFYFTLKEVKKDPIVESVVSKFLQRSKVGIEKYGTTLHENNTDDFINHAIEEAMDFTLYLQKIKEQRNEALHFNQFKEMIDKVKEFNEAFDIDYNENPKLHIDNCILRFKLMQEENTEYLEATTIEGVADALGDMLYILLGTILKHGMQDVIFDVFNEIHDSNMSKLENGKPLHREDGKIIKGKDYFKPNLEQFFK
jgi:predicted HAD superfamily Cof-like phosphohydrolase